MSQKKGRYQRERVIHIHEAKPDENVTERNSHAHRLEQTVHKEKESCIQKEPNSYRDKRIPTEPKLLQRKTVVRTHRSKMFTKVKGKSGV